MRRTRSVLLLMPYKRNPMRCERICALARYLMVDVLNPSFTTGTQWFERTLDDSANKRVAMAEGFLATDAILNIMLNVTDGLVVYPKVVRSRLMAELPFMASENIMMQAVEKGGNRQELHERLRQHAIAAGKQVKEEGLPNDMVDRIAADPAFGLTKEESRQVWFRRTLWAVLPSRWRSLLPMCSSPSLTQTPKLWSSTLPSVFKH